MADDRVFGVKVPELGPGLHDMVPASQLAIAREEVNQLRIRVRELSEAGWKSYLRADRLEAALEEAIEFLHGILDYDCGKLRTRVWLRSVAQKIEHGPDDGLSEGGSAASRADASQAPSLAEPDAGDVFPDQPIDLYVHAQESTLPAAEPDDGESEQKRCTCTKAGAPENPRRNVLYRDPDCPVHGED